MGTKTSPLDLRPSGLNTRFYGEDLDFNDYIELMQNIILESRNDLIQPNAAQIITANSPFLLTPKTTATTGILLVHGLFDSPFYVRDLGDYLVAKGYIVKAVLLPGHGTVPGDLLDIRFEEWLKAVDYGLRTLANNCDNVYLAGYSLGGVLAMIAALQNHRHPLKGMLLFAPALKPRSQLKKILAKYHKLFSWSSPYAKWYQLKEAENFVKYNSYAFNAGYQACKVITLFNHLLQSRQLDLPLFVTASSDDETISPQAILSFFLKCTNAASKFLLYTNEDWPLADERIELRRSSYPDLNIVNFSHSCLTISPANNVLGLKSETIVSKSNDSNVLLGAMTKKANSKLPITRLSYNPDFNYLLEQVSSFLDTTA